MVTFDADGMKGLTYSQASAKRVFDILVSSIGLLLTSWILLPSWVVASLDTRSNGFFIQKRVGRWGRIFKVAKLRTMRPVSGITTTITTASDARITSLGRFFRKTKIDEIPQLFNVLKGDMSFVGPRPDVPGFADVLSGEDRIVLSVRPGITGPATLKYRNEELLLAFQDDPESYNADVIWPDKIVLNRLYIQNWSFKQDFQYILLTLFSKN